MPKIRTLARGAALAAVVLLMTGCIKLDMDLKVSSNDKVSGTVIVAFNKQLLSLAGQSPDQVIQGSGVSVPASAAPGTKVEPYQDDQFAGEKVTYDNVDLSQFNQSGTADSLTITHVGNEFHVSGAVDFSNQTSANNPLGGAAQQTLSSAQLSIKLTFPGAVSSSNGQIDGNSVSWTPKIGEKTELTAVASAVGSGGGGGFPSWAVAAIVVVVVLAVGAFVVMRRRARAVAIPADPPPAP